jgi:hypothetical protein
MHGTNTRFDRLPWLDRGPANGPDSARCSRSPWGWRRSAIHLLSRLGFNRATTAMVGKTAPAAVRCYERQVPGSQDTAQAAEASEAAADDCLLHLRFAIIIAPGNLRPCRRGNYMPPFGLLLSDRTRMVCIWRKTAHCERGSGR